MRVQPIAAGQNRRIVAGIPFVEALARRMAASMPNSIDIGDLVQDGVLGLIDAAHEEPHRRRGDGHDECRGSEKDQRLPLLRLIPEFHLLLEFSAILPLSR